MVLRYTHKRHFSLKKYLKGNTFLPFDPYANDINFLLVSYLIPYVGLTGYVGTRDIYFPWLNI